MSHSYRGRQRKYARRRGSHNHGWAGSPREALEVGRSFEARVEDLLGQLVKSGVLDSFQRHEPNGPEDLEGKDFTGVQNGVSRSFGVTTSNRRWKKGYARHLERGVPNLLFSREASDESITQRILEFLNTGEGR